MKPQKITGERNKNLVTIVIESVFDTLRLREYFSNRSSYELLVNTALAPPYNWDIAVLPLNRLNEWIQIMKEYPVFIYGPGQFIGEAMSLGAADYLKEEWQPDELFYRLERYFSYFHPAEADTLPKEITDLLNHQEKVILSYLYAKQGIVVNREELQLHLWGKIKPQSRGIDMHICHIRQKILQAPSFHHVLSIETINGCGYLVNSFK